MKLRIIALALLRTLVVFAITSFAAQAQAGPRTILVVGDSLSAEYGLARGTGWVALLSKTLNGNDVVNASISGETTAGGRQRLAPLLEKHRPAIVIIELGGNDALRGLPLGVTQANLAAMIEQSKMAKARVLLVGMQLPPNYGAFAKSFAGMYGQIAREHAVELVPFLLAGIGDRLEFFQADRIHPTEKAQATMLNNVLPTLKRMLNKT